MQCKRSIICACLGIVLALSGYAMVAVSGAAYQSLPARAVGLLVVDAGAVLAAERRSGPSGAVLFARDGASYRWFYLPAIADEQGDSITVTVGPGEERKFANVVLATEKSLALRNVPAGYAAVDVEVNGGLGSPAADRFVATELRVLDDGVKVPSGLDSLVREALERCRTLPAEAGAEDVLDSLRRTTFSEGASIDRETNLVPRVTWLSQTSEVRVDCQVELVGQQSRDDIGTVPVERFAPQRSASLRHGKRLSVSIGATYMISPTGELSEESRSKLKSSVTMPPPRGGIAPRRP